MIDNYLDKMDQFDNIEIRIRMRVPRRFETEYPDIVQSIIDFSLGQFISWTPPPMSSPVIVTIKSEAEEGRE